MRRALRQLSDADRAALAEFETLHEQWRLADEAANVADRELERLFSRHAQGLGSAPSQQQIDRVVALRLAAAELHDRAMLQLRSAPI